MSAEDKDTDASPDKEEQPTGSKPGEGREPEEELTVGGVIEEPGPSRSRPIIYDVIGGLVLLFIIVAGIYYYVGFGGEQVQRQTPEVAQQQATGAEQPAGEEQHPSLEAPPPVEEWSPAEFQLPPPTQTSDVDAELAKAREHMQAGQLIKPEGNNALESFRSVLESDPGNQEAQQGIDGIVQRLIQQANGALDDGRLRDALELVSAARAIRPDAEGLSDLQSRVEAKREVINALSDAASDLKEGRLLEPEGNNALEGYRHVLELDPENSDARQGVVNVERRLLEMATTAARNLDFEKANQLIEQASGVRESDEAVNGTRDNIEQFRQDTLQKLATQATQALDQNDYQQAGDLIDQAAKVAPGGERVAELKQALTRATVYAKYKPGDTFTDELSSGEQGPAMVVIPVGSFRMGSPDSEVGHSSYEAPVHQVTFTKGIALSRTEVTVNQFRQFIEDTGYTTDAQKDGSGSVYSEDTGRVERRDGVRWFDDFHGEKARGDLPVIHVSWDDAQAYVNWLSKQTGHSYRLPSGAEFEYAARGGTTTPYWWGEGSPDRKVENLTGEDDRSSEGRSWDKERAFRDYDDGFWGPAPAGSFVANPFGLSDIGGNVSEWVQDCWHDSYARAPFDGSAWVNRGCKRRVVRGGSWVSPPERTRSAFRISGAPDTHTIQVGFRVARDL